ncbi:HsdM family class I SAM-dependent methyltransferase [Natronospira bacteriovora]|uniref:site-specific DNA-methyltransferase (adenine-specific) n=1 Tax=Natronospira bacteriovora TaxID=3069753 RepID=A0ABU0W715_9GAMM|nr:N-6 DNA methylase [Natronospira sp. AB-CW4]MDQ2069821.1 N-6 DNA methylase [Natronospira sp. AB-CW4]
MSLLDIKSELQSYGAPESAVRLLSEPSYDSLQYRDLFSGHSGTEDLPLRPSAVIEAGGSPLVFVVREPLAVGIGNHGKIALERLKSVLAFRGDNAYMAVLKPGQLDLYSVDRLRTLSLRESIQAGTPKAESYILDLAQGGLEDKGDHKRRSADRHSIHELMFNVLTHATKELLSSEGLRDNRDQVISLVGRALFTRFLIDRDILNEKTFPWLFRQNQGDATRCFSNARNAAKTCAWLDRTFNGNLLPLCEGKYNKFFGAFENDGSHPIFHELTKIAARAEASGQQLLDWGDINFAHVPVGLLSQVYEDYSHRFYGDKAKADSVHYTPSSVAKYVIDEAFEALTTSSPADAKVLDPAAGAGVFLTLAFQRLIAENWREAGCRPTTAEIRRILHEQIFGFDKNGSALRLSALSLYLTAIELDPEPGPPEDLIFPNLLGENLLTIGGDADDGSPEGLLGSLAMPIDKMRSQFDIVAANPPWTSWKGKPGKAANQRVDKIINGIIERRRSVSSEDEIKSLYSNPDLVPDLPFVWRSMEWAKPGGVLSFVLHGRFLFKQQPKPAAAREAIFNAVSVKGILNGSEIVHSVWDGMGTPFCVLLATNDRPKQDEQFYYVDPVPNSSPTGRTHIVVDYENARPIHSKTIINEPTIAKVLFTGTDFDASVIHKLESRLVLPQNYAGANWSSVNNSPMVWSRLGDYWTERLGLRLSQGYRKGSDKGPVPPELLRYARMLEKSDSPKYRIRHSDLRKFSYEELERARKPAGYKLPLAILAEAPGDIEGVVKAHWAGGSGMIAFNESYFGFSGYGHDDGDALTKYIFVLSNSSLFAYYNLMTSSRIGVERKALLLREFSQFPVPELSSLDLRARARIIALADSILKYNRIDQRSLDSFVYELYGIDAFEAQVVNEALELRSPYARAKERAQKPPTSKELNQFAKNLEEGLNEFGDDMGEKFSVRLVESGSETWKFIGVKRSNGGRTREEPIAMQLLKVIAENEGATRALLHQAGDQIVVAMRNQYQYWTPTRATMNILDLLSHFSTGGREASNG